MGKHLADKRLVVPVADKQLAEQVTDKRLAEQVADKLTTDKRMTDKGSDIPLACKLRIKNK